MRRKGGSWRETSQYPLFISGEGCTWHLWQIHVWWAPLSRPESANPWGNGDRDSTQYKMPPLAGYSGFSLPFNLLWRGIICSTQWLADSFCYRRLLNQLSKRSYPVDFAKWPLDEQMFSVAAAGVQVFCGLRDGKQGLVLELLQWWLRCLAIPLSEV